MIGTFPGGHVEFLKFQTGIFVEWKASHIASNEFATKKSTRR